MPAKLVVEFDRFERVQGVQDRVSRVRVEPRNVRVADQDGWVCTNGANKEETVNQTAKICPTGKMKASTVLMQLLSCDSISFRDCGSTAVREQVFSLIGHYKPRLPWRETYRSCTRCSWTWQCWCKRKEQQISNTWTAIRPRSPSRVSWGLHRRSNNREPPKDRSLQG
ncbi:hypothetical protein ACFX16_025681 [Malus domestica]